MLSTSIFDRSPVLEFDSVSKHFHRNPGGQRLIRERLLSMMRRTPRERFTALDRVSFSVARGESLGIIGHNGAGKSTLLNIATSLCRPSEGTVTVNGRVAALLELGSGFHPDLTGAENIRINAALLGLTRRQARERFEDIVEFSGIREFINEPLRVYSSGMMMRLAFSVAINVDPDILIVDEVLGVGDQNFFKKCFDRILEFRRAGKTMLCVSHSMEALGKLCDRALWLDHGRVVKAGPIEPMLKAYVCSSDSLTTSSGRV